MYYNLNAEDIQQNTDMVAVIQTLDHRLQTLD